MALREHRVRERANKVGMSSNKTGALTIVSCDMNLAVARNLGDDQSMVFKIPTTRSSVPPPAREDDGDTSSDEDTEHETESTHVPSDVSEDDD